MADEMPPKLEVEQDFREQDFTSFDTPQSRLGAFHVLKDVHVEISLEIGRRRMKIAEVLDLSTGQTIELNKAAGEPIDVFVNGQLLGRGEAVVVGDRYGVRITELVAPDLGDSL